MLWRYFISYFIRTKIVLKSKTLNKVSVFLKLLYSDARLNVTVKIWKNIKKLADTLHKISVQVHCKNLDEFLLCSLPSKKWCWQIEENHGEKNPSC